MHPLRLGAFQRLVDLGQHLVADADFTHQLVAVDDQPTRCDRRVVRLRNVRRFGVHAAQAAARRPPRAGVVAHGCQRSVVVAAVVQNLKQPIRSARFQSPALRGRGEREGT